MSDDYQPTMRELYDLVLSLKEVMELGFARLEGRLAGVGDNPEGRLAAVEAGLDGIERWSARVDQRLERLESGHQRM